MGAAGAAVMEPQARLRLHRPAAAQALLPP
jgi:hypothetical protein